MSNQKLASNLPIVDDTDDTFDDTATTDDDILEDDDAESGASLQAQLQLFLVTSEFGVVVRWVNVLFSFGLVLLYIVSTYLENEFHFAAIVAMIGMSSILFVRFLLLTFAAPKRVSFLLSPVNLVDVLSLTPIATLWMSNPGVEVLLFRIMWVTRILELRHGAYLFPGEFNQQIALTSVKIIFVVFVSAAIIQVAENHEPWYPDAALLSPSHEVGGISFLNSVYFVVVSLTTIGYGDIYPVTTLGRFIVGFMILVAFWIGTADMEDLMAIKKRQSVYVSKTFQPSSTTNHIIVCGAIGSRLRGALELDSSDSLRGNGSSVVSFFKEFFNEDHGSSERQAVVLAKGGPSVELSVLMTRPKFSIGITYLDGDVLVEKDLRRAAVERARGVFVLSNKYASNPDAEDSSTILRALAVKHYALAVTKRDILTCVQVLRPENRALFHTTTRSFLPEATFSANGNNTRTETYGYGRRSSVEATPPAHSCFPCCPRRIGPLVTPMTPGALRGMPSFANVFTQGGGGNNALLHNHHPSSLSVCIEEIKHNIMAQSCLCPGIATVVYNLIASDSEDLGESSADDDNSFGSGNALRAAASWNGNDSGNPITMQSPSDFIASGTWRQEYDLGCKYEIYRVPISPIFQGLPFTALATLVYEELDAILFGLEICPPELPEPRVVLNPGRFRIPPIASNHVYGFVIAQDKAKADGVATLGISRRRGRRTSTNITMSSSQQHRHSLTPATVPRMGTARLGSLMDTGSGDAAESHADADALRINRRLRELRDDENMRLAGRRLSAAMDPAQKAAALAMLARQRTEQNAKKTETVSPVVNPKAYGLSSKEQDDEDEEGAERSREEAATASSGRPSRQLSSASERSAHTPTMRTAKAAEETMFDVEEEVSRLVRNDAKRRRELRERIVALNTPIRPLSSAAILSVDDPGPGMDPIMDHVVVLGACEKVDLYHFVKPLREAHHVDNPPVVIVGDTPLDTRRWAKLSIFDRVHFLHGSSMLAADLLRAGVDRAVAVVLFTDTSSASGATDAVLSGDTLVDADAICIYRLIKTIAPQTEVVVEIAREENIAFLVSGDNDYPPIQSPPFVAGHVFTPSFVDILLCQAYYNPFVIKVVELLIGASNRAAERDWKRHALPRLGQLHDSHTFLVPVPTTLVGQTFGVLFTTFLRERNMLALGIRRAADIPEGTPSVASMSEVGSIRAGVSASQLFADSSRPNNNNQKRSDSSDSSSSVDSPSIPISPPRSAIRNNISSPGNRRPKPSFPPTAAAGNLTGGGGLARSKSRRRQNLMAHASIRGNALPYTITNPPKATVLGQGDAVFVLSQRAPIVTYANQNRITTAEVLGASGIPRMATVADMERLRRPSNPTPASSHVRRPSVASAVGEPPAMPAEFLRQETNSDPIREAIRLLSDAASNLEHKPTAPRLDAESTDAQVSEALRAITQTKS